MYVAFHRSHDHSACFGAAFLFSGLDERLQDGYCLLHGAGGLHYLRQEHLALAEELSHLVHAVHERSFDYVYGPGILGKGFAEVFFEVLRQTFAQRVAQTGVQRLLAPRVFCLAGSS